MMTAVLARGQAVAAAARDKAVARLAARARESLPGIEVATEEDRVVLSGRGLARRWLDDATLRWIGSLLR